MSRILFVVVFALVSFVAGCGDETEADRRGVGAECTTNDDCTEANQVCLTNFKGGYCGVKDCTTNAGCPGGSGCVTHSDSVNYCFRLCDAKAECNANRTVANESNCSGSITWADVDLGKACVPPSGN